jgi:C4-dicarboxylate-specific signal transduction histidine kinase
MQRKPEELLRVKEIAFMGKVTASLSHEIKNTLAIINESAGLMGDLLKKDASEDWPQYSRLTGIVTLLEEQVQRSADIVKRLNQFAHSMDKSMADLDLNETVGQTAILAQRFATLSRVNLETILDPKPLQIHSDPFRALYIIFGFIERAINCSPKQAKVTVKTCRSGEMLQVMVTDQGAVEVDTVKAQISASLSPEAERDESDLAVLVQTMKALGGTIAAEQAAETGSKIVLSFPSRFPGI